MSFQKMLSFQYRSGGLDKIDLLCYDEGSNCSWIFAPHVGLVSRPRLTEVTIFWRLIPAHTVSSAHLFKFLLG